MDAGGPLPPISTPLPEFIAEATSTALTAEERALIVGQSIVLLHDVYPHLSAKQALYGVDPLDRLRRLRDRLDAQPIDDLEFHREMVSVFASLYDLHTAYLLPSAFRRRMAMLPFVVEAYGAPADQRFIVTGLREGVAGEEFGRGTEILHWNGIPIARAVELLGQQSSGANPAARHAKGVERLTSRYVAREFEPDERWVHVGYAGDPSERERRFEWEVIELPEELPAQEVNRFRLGLDVASEAYRRLRVELYSKPRRQPEPMPVEELRQGPYIRGTGPLVPPEFEHLFAYRPVEHGSYGYLRIYSFATKARDRFVETIAALLEHVPADGLIIDVRRNPGGDVTAAEGLLQLLTGRVIEPERFQLKASETVRRIAQADKEFRPWQKRFEASMRTAAALTPAAPIDVTSANALGQRYQGPVVLVVDAQSYSATDIFAAGFQDHEIGDVLGCAARTGGGGATVAEHDELCKLEIKGGNPLKPLPCGVSFTVALRRSVRVRDNHSVPVEDFGVTPERFHELTRDDLLYDNTDLIAAAVECVKSQRKRPRLTATRHGATLRIETTATIVDRVQLLLDGAVQRSIAIPQEPCELPLSEAEQVPGAVLQLVGYSRGTRIVSCSVPPEAPPADDLFVM